MRTTLTTRHCTVADEIRAKAITVMEKLALRAGRTQRAAVVFDADHGQTVVELMLYLPRGRAHVATAEADEFRTALDRAAAKMRRQLDKGGLPRAPHRARTT